MRQSVKKNVRSRSQSQKAASATGRFELKLSGCYLGWTSATNFPFCRILLASVWDRDCLHVFAVDFQIFSFSSVHPRSFTCFLSHYIYIYVYIIRLSDYQTICVVKSLNPIDFSIYPLVISYVAIDAMAHFEIVDWPMNSMVIVHSFVVCLPEGKSHEKSREKSHLTSINSHGKSHFLGGKSPFFWVNHIFHR